ncbi:MAG: DUF3299 domain-containing protein [Pseudomonadaceae bacterium]|nr:DUF3299 domain-containing protein [Pseudomonadaceae bacterium]
MRGDWVVPRSAWKALSLIVCATVFSGFSLLAAADAAVRQIGWDDLLPAAPPLADVQDGTSSSVATQPAIMQSGAFVPELAGQMVKLPGFVVPLESDGETVRTFLLVPYFGACIHMPPPPANQIVHVELDDAVPVDSIYDAVWVTGEMSLDTYRGDLAEAGYSMKGKSLETYTY